jgi:hypothetical protein
MSKHNTVIATLPTSRSAFELRGAAPLKKLLSMTVFSYTLMELIAHVAFCEPRISRKP